MTRTSTVADAILISGVSDYSLGMECVRSIRRVHTTTPLLVFSHGPYSANAARDQFASIIDFELNPLEHAASYREYSANLDSAIEQGCARNSATRIKAVIQSAGVYDAGPFEKHHDSTLSLLVGVNVCGSIAILRSAMLLNSSHSEYCRDAMSLIQVGAIHSLKHSPGRALYSATKALSIDLCESLVVGEELRRAVYLAPGPIDTHMLHRNHWVNKSGGSVPFFEILRERHSDRYADVFMSCDRTAITEIAECEGFKKSEVESTFERYRQTRQQVIDSDLGLIATVELAEWIECAVHNESAYPSGIYVATAPRGALTVRHYSFEDWRPSLLS